MTVTYSDEIATAKFQTLFKLLLLRWKGSVFKLLWKDLLLYLSVFYLIHIIYMVVLDEEGRVVFEALVVYFKRYEEFIPLSFVLGFFVSNVTARWWDQYQTIPWPYGIAVYVSSTIQGYDEVGRAMRRTIMRYVCLSLTMVFRVLSPRVKARFPLMADLVEAGLLTQNELTIIEEMDQKFPGYSKNWLPIVWAASLVNRARDEKRIRDDFAVKTLIEELNKFRGMCGVLMIYNSICIPLVYTQVVTIAVYSYFTTAIISQQYIHKSTDNSESLNLDYIPILITLQFIFYMGWLKVAETMINPFGEDDDDFEINYMIDRNIQMSYLIVDEMHNNHPELLKDQYWNQIPNKLPDRFKQDHEEEKKPNEPTDTFNVVEKQISQQRATIVLNINALDVEALSPSLEKLKPTGSSTDPNLVPRSSVIDTAYKEVLGVESKQSSLDREKEKIRMKEIFELIDRSSSDDSKSSEKERQKKPRSLKARTSHDSIKEQAPKDLKQRPTRYELIETGKKSRKTSLETKEEDQAKISKPNEKIQEPLVIAEAAPASLEKIKPSGSNTDPSLIPRSSVIDTTYKEVIGVEAKQSILNREMERLRLKSITDKLERSPDENSASDIENVREINQRMLKKQKSQRSRYEANEKQGRKTVIESKEEEQVKVKVSSKSEEKIRKQLDNIKEEESTEDSETSIAKIKKEKIVPKKIKKQSFDSESFEKNPKKEDRPKKVRTSLDEDEDKKIKPRDQFKKSKRQRDDKASGSRVRDKKSDTNRNDSNLEDESPSDD